MSDLQEYLTQETDSSGFIVDTDSKANWTLRKIKQLQEQAENNNNIASNEIERINGWNTNANRSLLESIDYFQSLLGSYAQQKREADPKFKSLKLPNGNIGFRKQQPKWNYDDSVVEALDNAGLGEYLRVTRSPSKADIKKNLKVFNGKVINPHTGEFIEGITVEDQEDSFNVKVGE